MQYKDKVLILTPVKDAEQFLDTYFKLIYGLTYPHDLISIGILESDSSDYSFPPFLYGIKSPLIKGPYHFEPKRAMLKRAILNAMKGIRKLNLEQLIEAKKTVAPMLKGGYSGEIETEGLGIMTHDMGYECWGMPNLEIKHRDS